MTPLKRAKLLLVASVAVILGGLYLAYLEFEAGFGAGFSGPYNESRTAHEARARGTLVHVLRPTSSAWRTCYADGEPQRPMLLYIERAWARRKTWKPGGREAPMDLLLLRSDGPYPTEMRQPRTSCQIRMDLFGADSLLDVQDRAQQSRCCSKTFVEGVWAIPDSIWVYTLNSADSLGRTSDTITYVRSEPIRRPSDWGLGASSRGGIKVWEPSRAPDGDSVWAPRRQRAR